MPVFTEADQWRREREKVERMRRQHPRDRYVHAIVSGAVILALIGLAVVALTCMSAVGVEPVL